jgi:DeoR/GlpR family transcriptional regulator of sugar metabolism
LADNGKFGATYPATFGRAEDFDRLVTDVDTHSSYADDLSQRGVEVVLA